MFVVQKSNHDFEKTTPNLHLKRFLLYFHKKEFRNLKKSTKFSRGTTNEEKYSRFHCLWLRKDEEMKTFFALRPLPLRGVHPKILLILTMCLQIRFRNFVQKTFQSTTSGQHPAIDTLVCKSVSLIIFSNFGVSLSCLASQTYYNIDF